MPSIIIIIIINIESKKKNKRNIHSTNAHTHTSAHKPPKKISSNNTYINFQYEKIFVQSFCVYEYILEAI